ncbi:cytochrome P450 2K1-like [Lissotriton helveticus]
MYFPDPGAVSALLACVLGLVVVLRTMNGRKSEKHSNFPPGPRPLPVIGNLHLIGFKTLDLTLLELSKEYGSVFSVHIGPLKAVVLAGYETVKDALVNHAKEFSERAHVPIFQETSKGNGLVLSHGENWKVMRRFTQATLRDLGMGKRTIEDKITEECELLLKNIESYQGTPFNNTMIMNAAVANIIVSIVLGHRYDYEDKTYLRLISLITENFRALASPMTSLFNIYPTMVRFLPGGHKVYMKNIREIETSIRTTFVQYLKDLNRNDQRSLIDAFLVRQQEEKPDPHIYFHNENLTSLVNELLAAGAESTSITLRWGLLLMMKYPEIQENVQKEIDRVIGSAKPQSEHRRQMPYTDAVIHEVQRFANIIPSVPHETTMDVHFKGYFIPKGTYVIVLLSSVLNDKAHFERPEEFNPQHFLDSDGNRLKKEAFMPFSAGQRVCLGENLAKMVIFIFFTSLLQKFTFSPPANVTHVDISPGIGFAVPPLPHRICAVSRY